MKHFLAVIAAFCSSGIIIAAGEPKAGSDKTVGGIRMVYCPSGSFSMGSSDSESFVLHEVKLNGFWMSKYEISFRQFSEIVKLSGIRTTEELTGSGWINSPGEGAIQKKGISWKNPDFEQVNDNPVVVVSWYDAVLFCNELSRINNLSPCYSIDKIVKDPSNTSDSDPLRWSVKVNWDADGFRLPTEAEWEYSYRAGTSSPYYWGRKIDGGYCWFTDNSSFRIHTVGTKKANAWGLFDMSGNTAEWCSDWYEEGYSGKSGKLNPRGAYAGKRKIVRGGSFQDSDELLSAYFATSLSPEYGDQSIGFRVVCCTK
jgi:formylglycine-generating enzyme required for sulfatase activity